MRAMHWGMSETLMVLVPLASYAVCSHVAPLPPVTSCADSNAFFHLCTPEAGLCRCCGCVCVAASGGGGLFCGMLDTRGMTCPLWAWWAVVMDEVALGFCSVAVLVHGDGCDGIAVGLVYFSVRRYHCTYVSLMYVVR